MRIKLSDFELPGQPGLTGDVTYTSITENERCKLEINERLLRTYCVTGYAKGDDGRDVGVFINGTLKSNPELSGMRVIRLIEAPEIDGAKLGGTRFYWSEQLEGSIVRFTGSVILDEKEMGFLYEGHDDGSGDWYPIEVEGEDSCRVIGSRWKMLVVDGDEGSDAIHCLSLNSMEWTTLHTGFALPKTVYEIHHVDDTYTIKGEFTNGAEFEATYRDESLA